MEETEMPGVVPRDAGTPDQRGKRERERERERDYAEREQEREKVEGRWIKKKGGLRGGSEDVETKKETIELLPTQRLSYLMIYSSVPESR